MLLILGVVQNIGWAENICGFLSNVLSKTAYEVDKSCSSPKKEKNSKPLTGENVVPREQPIKINPNREKQGGILEKESPEIANSKDDPNGCQT